MSRPSCKKVCHEVVCCPQVGPRGFLGPQGSRGLRGFTGPTGPAGGDGGAGIAGASIGFAGAFPIPASAPPGIAIPLSFGFAVPPTGGALGVPTGDGILFNEPGFYTLQVASSLDNEIDVIGTVAAIPTVRTGSAVISPPALEAELEAGEVSKFTSYFLVQVNTPGTIVGANVATSVDVNLGTLQALATFIAPLAV